MEGFPINLTDAAILAILALSAAFAFFRGFVHETLAVVSWVGSALATLYGFPYAQPKAREFISSPLLADMVAGIAIFLIVLIILTIVTRSLSRRIQDSSLGPLDRSLGLVFGALRGAVLVCVAWLLMVWVLPREDMPDWITEARGLPLVERGGALIVKLIPEKYQVHPAETPAPVKPGKIAADGDDLLIPPAARGAAPQNKPGYKGTERDAMQQLIEAATQNDAAAEQAGR